MKRPSHRLVLALLCLATITSSLGIERSSEAVSQPRRRRTAISIPSFGSEIHDATMRLLEDEKRFPVKRRWNSGNLRVWGKRSSSVPDISFSSLDDQLYDQSKEGPLWLLPTRLTNNEQAPVQHAQSSDERDVKRSNEHSTKNVPWLF